MGRLWVLVPSQEAHRLLSPAARGVGREQRRQIRGRASPVTPLPPERVASSPQLAWTS